MIRLSAGLTVCFVLLFVIGCSSITDLSTTTSENTTEEPKVISNETGGQLLWGVWDLLFDPDSLQVEITSSRELAPHFNVTSMVLPPNCMDCLNIVVTAFDPLTSIADANVTLKNPASLPGYDVRGALYTTQYGHELLNPDDWTPSYDIPGGLDINPFRAFAKDEVKRKFAVGASHTEHYQVQLPKPPLFTYIQYVVTASWPGNARDPYQITNFTQEEISSELTSSGVVSVDVFDWQNDIGSVWFYAQAINGVEYVEMTQTSGNTWQVNLVNTEGAAAGDYPVKFRALSTNATNLPLYDFSTLTITPQPPPKGWGLTWGGTLGDEALDVAVDSLGNAYIVGFFQETADLDPHPSVDEHISNGNMDAFLIKISSDGIYQWGLSWGGANEDICRTVAVDASDSIYIGGHFRETVDFDPGPGVQQVTSNGGSDVFFCKYNTDGVLLWVGTWGSASGEAVDTAWDIATDLNDNVIIAGAVNYGNIDFDPGPGEAIPPPVAGDSYLSKFNSSCEFQWVGRWGCTLGSTANGVAVDDSGNIYVTGSYNVYEMDLDPGPGSDVHANSGGEDAYLSKFDQDGLYKWGRSWGGGSNEAGMSLATYGTGTIYVRGYFGSTVDFDPGPGVDSHTPVIQNDDYISKFNGTGNFLWVDTWDGNLNAGHIHHIDTNSFGDIITVGSITTYWGPVDLDPGPGVDEYTSSGGYTSYFDPSGAYQWARLIIAGHNIYNTAVVNDASNNLYVVGTFEDSVELDPGPDLDNHTGNGGYDAFIVKYDPAGNW